MEMANTGDAVVFVVLWIGILAVLYFWAVTP